MGDQLVCCAVLRWCEWMVRQPGKWRHAQAEGSITSLLTPEDEVAEQKVHEAIGSFRPIPHQIDGERAACAIPDVRESSYAAVQPHDGLIELEHIARVEMSH